MQYGIRLAMEEEMTWAEFCRLLGGILPDTPLGRIVAIRSEKDLERLRKMTAYEKNVRKEWRRFYVGREREAKSEKEVRRDMAALQRILQEMFG